MTNSAFRSIMCDIACQVDPRIHICTYELDKKFRGETYHMIKMLLEESWVKDRYDFSLIIGMDNALSFYKWVNPDDLERLVRFVVVPRKGIKPDPQIDWYLKPPHIYLKGKNPPEDISSTQIRAILKRFKNYPEEMPKTLNKFLDPNIYKYIRQNNLYKREKYRIKERKRYK